MKGGECNLKKKTHEEYVAEIAIKNPSVEVVGQYNGTHRKIMHHCLIHDVYWESKPGNVLLGKGCKKCQKERIGLANRKSKQKYIEEVAVINPNVVVLGEYITIGTPILHKCINHDIEWMAYPNIILRGEGCSKCGGEKTADKFRKTHAQYEEELKLTNPNIAVIGSYFNANAPILHKCLIDGNKWYARPSNILSGCGCPRCNESKGEKAVRKWLETHNIKYEQQKRFSDCRDKKSLPFDFYLPEYNSVIEYNGIQHYIANECFGGEDALSYTQRHDRIKEGYCKTNNIGYLCIPYFKNVDIELNNFFYLFSIGT